MRDQDDLPIDRSFGPRFLAARKEKGVSQEAVAEALTQRGIRLHVTAIGKIERGERRVSVGEASALASVLGYTLDSLIGGGGDLVTHYALLDYARTVLQRQSHDYLTAMLNVAITADNLGDQLRPEDRQWLRNEMPRQTPARTGDTQVFAEARLSRDGIAEPGEYLALLMDAIKRDADALRESSEPDG